METKRYEKNKRIPTNNDIFNFFNTYGIICLIAIAILFIVFIQVSPMIIRSIECGDVEWNLTNYNNNNKVLYNDDIYTITNINNYESLERMNIELKKVK